jgi:hypothetical protein
MPKLTLNRIFGFSLLGLLAGLALNGFAETPVHAPAGRLIIPGKSIGELRLGPDTGEYNGAESDDGDAAMGGRRSSAWYLGARRGDKGRPFHRPDMIGTASLKDMEHDSAKTPGKLTITEVYVTSPRFATADGIAHGSKLDAILAKYPDAHSGDDDPANWALYGNMQFYRDQKHGIAFAIQKSSGVCVEVCVMPPGEGEFFIWGRPLATDDYLIDTIEQSIGSIKIGMSGAEIIALLGKPDQKAEAGSMAGGSWWRWRLPSQAKEETPCFSIYMRKLPGGDLGAYQIRVTSPAFTVTDLIFPGCPLKDALEATWRVAKIDTSQYDVKGRALGTDRAVYGDLFSGLLFDIRTSDSVCTAISIFPAPLDYH